ncbi:hypothetical protein OKW50_008427 [Paraburkholderia youngii]
MAIDVRGHAGPWHIRRDGGLQMLRRYFNDCQLIALSADQGVKRGCHHVFLCVIASGFLVAHDCTEAANNPKSSAHLAPEVFLLGSPAHAVPRTWLGRIAALAHCYSYILAIVGCPCRL